MIEVYLQIPQTNKLTVILGVKSSDLTIEEMIEALLNSVAAVSKLMERANRK